MIHPSETSIDETQGSESNNNNMHLKGKLYEILTSKPHDAQQLLDIVLQRFSSLLVLEGRWCYYGHHLALKL